MRRLRTLLGLAGLAAATTGVVAARRRATTSGAEERRTRLPRRLLGTTRSNGSSPDTPKLRT